MSEARCKRHTSYWHNCIWCRAVSLKAENKKLLVVAAAAQVVINKPFDDVLDEGHGCAVNAMATALEKLI